MLLFLLVSCIGNPADTGTIVDSGGGEDTPEVDDPIFDIDPESLPQGAQPCRAPILAEVEYTIDGDTIHVLTDQGSDRIRLIGVNAPEVGWDGDASECYGDESAVFVESHLEGRWIWLTFDQNCEDAYERALAYVHTAADDQGFFQRNLLQGGYAQSYSWEGTDTFSELFSQDESIAQNSNAGLWGACN